MYQRRKDTIREDNANGNIHTLDEYNNNNNNNNSNNNNNNNLYNYYNQDNFDSSNSVWEDKKEFRYYESSNYDFVKMNKCLICHTDFNANDVCQLLYCGHLFHKSCLTNQQIDESRRDLPCAACFNWVYQNF